MMRFPLPAETVIPHRQGMCCIDILLSASEQQATASVTLQPQHLLLTADGTLDRSGFIELAAQTACAMKGAEVDVEPLSITALLAGVRDFSVWRDARVNQTLMIFVSISSEIAGVSLVNFRITGNTHLLASGELKVFYQATHSGSETVP